MEEEMSPLRYAMLAALALSVAPAAAGERGPIGSWQPLAAEGRYTDATMLVFDEVGRFAALVARPVSRPNGLTVASGSWTLSEDGGELVLTLDPPTRAGTPGERRFVQMLFLGEELRPFPGMRGRSPVAATAWRRIEGALASGMEERAAR
jgi:hypothetical protein